MVAIRPAQASDLKAIAALDARLTGSDKPSYWQEMLAPERHFLVAETGKGALAGFIAGEVRAWEFGQPPAGWVLEPSIATSYGLRPPPGSNAERAQLFLCELLEGGRAEGRCSRSRGPQGGRSALAVDFLTA